MESPPHTPKVWFVTGASRGFGRLWSDAAAARGDFVAAAARRKEDLAGLVAKHGDRVLPVRLDVRDRSAAFDAVQAAHRRFGRLDVVVNNAGYGLVGMAEELTESQIRDQIETNLLGAIWVTQAALPILREQRAGHLIQVSSIGGIVATPRLAAYHAAKWGLEGFSDALAQEISAFGIHVTLVEPATYSTDVSSSAQRAEPMVDYAVVHERAAMLRTDRASTQRTPEATCDALLEIVDSVQPPLRVLFGDVLETIESEYRRRLQIWSDWEHLSKSSDGASPAPNQPSGGIPQ